MSPIARHPSNRQGFSLIEILVVLAIIAILVSLVIGIAGGVQRGAAESKAKAEIASLMTEFEKYKEDLGVYPPKTGFANAFTTWYSNRYDNAIYSLTEIRRNGTNFSLYDPWGRTYDYDYNASNPNVYSIGSRGADGSANTGDDINNRNGSL